ncbi:MAG: hypothetical protein J0L56_13730, partial [Chitinophagales bacterium]|nr:hypothetical protein [Chitinophagales bacterium]
MAALSEVVWSSRENRNWESFEKRLMTQFKRYEKWGADYSKAYFDLKATAMPSKDNNSVSWKLESKIIGSVIQYRDAEDKDDTGVSDFFDYTVPLNVEKTTTYEAMTKITNQQVGNTLIQKFYFNKATGKPITLHIPPSKNYPGDGAFTLVNGIQNQKGLARSKEFLGFSGADCEALINLGSFQEIASVTVHVFQQKSSWIWNPASVEVFSSVDGMYFSSVGSSGDVTATASGNGTITVNCNNTLTSFIKVIVKNFGNIPEGNPGSGKKAWLFVDEIEVN